MDTETKKFEDWIKNNLNDIIEHTNLEILLEHIKRKKVFPDILLVQYELPIRNPLENKKLFYLDIIQRKLPLTSQKYQLLLEACQESNQQTLYLILKAEPSVCAKDPNIVENTAACLNLRKLKIIVKTSEKLMDVSNDPEDIFPPYPMRGPKRGVALIINNIEFVNDEHEKRNGADVDADNLKELFAQLKFELVYWKNLTYKDMRTKLREFTSDSNKILGEVDSCFVIIMSHGGQGSNPEDTHIYTHDNKPLKASYVIRSFSNSNCKLLQGKPKVIIFQACRGELKEFGITVQSIKVQTIKVQMDTTKTDEGKTETQVFDETISNGESDMLVCYTTSPGCISFRDTFKGTWFIRCFCKIIMNHAYNKDVLTLFGMIAIKVFKKRTENDELQKPHIHNIIFRPCYLNPVSPKQQEINQIKKFNESIDDINLFNLPNSTNVLTASTDPIYRSFDHLNLSDLDLPNSTNVLTPYSMNGKKRGIAIVINNIEFKKGSLGTRHGAEVNTESLRHLFNQLEFEWLYWENVTYKELVEILDEFTNDSKKTLRDFNICFFIIMSHGDSSRDNNETLIYSSDNILFKASYIIEKFSNSNCKSLQGKPKILIFDMSQGTRVPSRGKPGKSIDMLDDDISDMLICYSSKPGCVSFRNTETGTWLIESFCEVFRRQAYSTDVETLFDTVATNVAENYKPFISPDSKSNLDINSNSRQLPYIQVNNFRKCYLNELNKFVRK